MPRVYSYSVCHVYIVIFMSRVYSYIVCHVYIVILYATCIYLYCMSRVYSYSVCHVYIVILYATCIKLYYLSRVYSCIVCYVHAFTKKHYVLFYLVSTLCKILYYLYTWIHVTCCCIFMHSVFFNVYSVYSNQSKYVSCERCVT